MGNREDLLAAARRCLYEKGYAGTTARDLAMSAGVSLAAIGYHFGSKQALLNAALAEAMQEWGDSLERVAAADVATNCEPATLFEVTWTKVIDSFAASGPLWAVQFELLAHLERNPDLRETMAAANHHARRGLLELFGAATPPGDGPHATAVGMFYQALLVGVAALCLADPQNAPSGRQMLDAARAVATHLAPAGDQGSHRH